MVTVTNNYAFLYQAQKMAPASQGRLMKIPPFVRDISYYITQPEV
jgi:hypothetical protein